MTSSEAWWQWHKHDWKKLACKKPPENKYRNFGCSRFNRKTNISGKYADPCDTTAACVCLLICMYFSSFALLYVHRMQLHHVLEDIWTFFLRFKQTCWKHICSSFMINVVMDLLWSYLTCFNYCWMQRIVSSDIILWWYFLKSDKETRKTSSAVSV